jgi:tRNA uridine 5-carboxymethylaminomethyl modification enzyme
MSIKYDVVVVGGGHAGAEAATAASRLGASVLLVTTNLETIGQMSCNPAIGGIAKGTVVREVDALGGVMGRATDRSTIHFRMLNRSKGPAVWSPRSQCDRGLYRRAVRRELEKHDIKFLQATVAALRIERDAIVGVTLSDGEEIACRSAVITAGTFLRGRIHVGGRGAVSGGRAGDAAVEELAVQMDAYGLEVERFKTGTPPRVDGRTVDFSVLERQDGEVNPYRFSEYVDYERPGALPCWIAWSGEELKEIVHAHLNESALHGGDISGRGPRYCPSIEDKVVRFPDATGHQVFLEPEGLETTELYVNGLSTSLPSAVQLEFLRAVPGMADVEMTRAGYAIEYDYYPPKQLTTWLETKTVDRLFLAGQINGTTGYEEAAAQGLVAGINAVLRGRGDDPFVVQRDEGYVGVLVDDLVTKGVDEPYRLFTSRAEYRLLLRQDNAIHRLGDRARKLGLLDPNEEATLDKKVSALAGLLKESRSRTLKPEAVGPLMERHGQALPKESRKISDLAKRPLLSLKELFSLGHGDIPVYEENLWLTAEIEMRYEGYLEREREAVERMKRMSDFDLPVDFPYSELLSLSTEARQKLADVRPESMAQAGRIPGVSPSDLQNLVFELMKQRKQKV